MQTTHMVDLEMLLPLRKSDAITPILLAWQLRAARAAAGVSAKQLADLSGLSINTIRRAEQDGVSRMSRVNQRALLATLQALGIELAVNGVDAVVYRAPEPDSQQD